MISTSVIVLSSILGLAITSIVSAKDDIPKTVVDLAVKDPQLSKLVGALKVADLVDILQTDGPFTVFAPKNYPFKQISDGILERERLLDPKWRAHLQDLLLYHVFVGAKVFSTDLKPSQTVEMANGGSVSIMAKKGMVSVNEDAKVKEADIEAENGVVHKISEVLIPDSAKYNIVQLGIENPKDFSILVKLVVAAGLDEALSGSGPFTLFAPRNGAFRARLGKKVIKKLLKPKNKDTLVEILKYHVVPGIVLSKDLSDEAVAPTLQGSGVTVNINKHGVIRLRESFRDVGSKVVDTDILANNGVIHVIADVLLPPSMN